MPMPTHHLAGQKTPPQEQRASLWEAALVGPPKRDRPLRPLLVALALALRKPRRHDLSTPFNCSGRDSGPEVSPYELRRRRAQEPGAKSVNYSDSEK